MVKHSNPNWFHRLLVNSRFWILTSGIVLSVNIAGFIQLIIPSGSLQIIRIEQVYAFIAIFLLFLAMLASPLTKAFPNLPFKEFYLHARRAIGVLAFYYAFLHVYLTFFKQLGGFNGIQYYTSKYRLALLLGIIALWVLFLMTITSLDWAVKVMTFKRWKLLHRLVYFASLAILFHLILIGSHYAGLGTVAMITAVAVLVLLYLEGLRIYQNVAKQKANQKASHK